jgi:hypothetical protein
MKTPYFIILAMALWIVALVFTSVIWWPLLASILVGIAAATRSHTTLGQLFMASLGATLLGMVFRMPDWTLLHVTGAIVPLGSWSYLAVVLLFTAWTQAFVARGTQLALR